MRQTSEYARDRDLTFTLPLALIAITLIGLALRLYRLDYQSLWMDEVASLGNAIVYSKDGLQGVASVDHIAPLHSMILWLSIQLGGATAYAIRLPSALGGALLVPVTYLLAVRIVGSKGIGLLSAALVAISPFAIWYSQEARMYSLFLLFSALYVLLSYPLLSRPLRLIEHIALLVVTAAVAYLHHYAALLALSFGMFALVCVGIGRARLWLWGINQALSFSIFAYWMYLTSDKLGANAGFEKPTALLWLPYTFFNFVGGSSLGPSVREIRSGSIFDVLLSHWFVLLPALCVVGILMLCGAIRTLRGEAKVGGTWLLIWMLAPMALAVALTFVSSISYNARYVIMSFPPFVILIAAGLSLLWEISVRGDAGRVRPVALGGGLARRLAVVGGPVIGLAGAALLGMALSNHYFNPRYFKEDARSLAAFVSESLPPGAIVLADNSRVLPILEFYGAKLPSSVPAIDNIQGPRTPALIAQTSREMARQAPANQVWLIEYRSWETDPWRRVRTELDQDRKLIRVVEWAGIAVRIYAGS